MKQLLVLKFYCSECNYTCKYLAHWKQHIESKKHINKGKRQPRSDKVLKSKCELCNFTTNNLTNMKTHQLTKHLSIEQRKKEFTFYCEICDFGTFGEVLYNRHLETKKHINLNK